MPAYAGASRPHTCVSGLPGYGGWGGQRPPSWATATGPGLFRSLGFRNPSGYWLLRRSTYSHTRRGRAGRRRGACMWCGCVCCTAVPWDGVCDTLEGSCSNGSAAGACREGGGSIRGWGGGYCSAVHLTGSQSSILMKTFTSCSLWYWLYPPPPFICLRVCMTYFVSRVLCIVIGGVREPLRPAAYYARDGGPQNEPGTAGSVCHFFWRESLTLKS